MRTTIAVSELLAGDLVTQGHGYGERPAVVAAAGRFTSGTEFIRFTDGRVFTIPTGHLVTVETSDDYETVRDSR